MPIAENYLAAEQVAGERLAEIYRKPSNEWVAPELWHIVESGLQANDPERIILTEDQLTAASLTARGYYQARLLDAYLPHFRARAAEQDWDGIARRSTRQKVVELLAENVDSQGLPTDSGARGRVAELIALYFTPSYPGSPREEKSAISPQYNHDCYWWDGTLKVPQQMKYRRTSGGKAHPAIDKDVILLIKLGFTLAKRFDTCEPIRDRFGTKDENGEIHIGSKASTPLLVRTLLRHHAGTRLDGDGRRILAIAREALLYCARQFKNRQQLPPADDITDPLQLL